MSETTGDKVYKTPEYIRKAHKAYRDRNPDKVKERGLSTYYKNKDSQLYKEKKKLNDNLQEELSIKEERHKLKI